MKVRFAPLLLAIALLWLAGCRASGPGTPARTVAQFFSKYENRPGFKATDWNAGLATRFLLGRLGKLGGNSDLSQALTSIRSAKILTFTPTSNSAQQLLTDGLDKEVAGLLASERYTPLPVANADPDIPNQLRYSVREQNDRVTELVAVGGEKTTGSFVLMAISGSFTRAQVAELSKVLPNVASGGF
ncbi:DUF4252 domain-containing protein [Hymenobacter actinosclerus]|uniref:DUF4252 domain-containing protein n=1 Tax=Hymenobacter actinosclerus TaxID=82805 RepID=A0A1I0AGX7_9BACT|nr:DUF4252 domain-containing protein [Hymenobacter actinosclerus]SES93429.1 protein of unknown function [Hymenobacter actinosclerus]